MGNKVKTRMFAPGKQKSGLPLPVGEDEILPAPMKRRSERGLTLQSRVLLILAIFITAGAAIFGLRGSAEVSEIYIDIAALEDEIARIEQNLSQVIKDQGQLHGYSSIYDANEGAGKVLFWDD